MVFVCCLPNARGAFRGNDSTPAAVGAGRGGRAFPEQNCGQSLNRFRRSGRGAGRGWPGRDARRRPRYSCHARARRPCHRRPRRRSRHRRPEGGGRHDRRRCARLRVRAGAAPRAAGGRGRPAPRGLVGRCRGGGAPGASIARSPRSSFRICGLGRGWPCALSRAMHATPTPNSTRSVNR